MKIGKKLSGLWIVIALFFGAPSLFADEWYDDGYMQGYEMDPFIVNSDDPETFDWSGFFDALSAEGYSVYDADDPIGLFSSSGGGWGSGPLGSGYTKNTYPYNQTSTNSCGVNAARNAEHILKGTARDETTVANSMAKVVGRTGQGQFGDSPDDPNDCGLTKKTAMLNSALNDVGIQATKGGWTDSSSAATVFANAAANNQVLVVGVVLGFSVEANHAVVLQPFYDSSHTLLVRQIDSGTHNNGNATVTEHSAYDATFIPLGTSAGATGNVWVIQLDPNG